MSNVYRIDFSKGRLVDVGIEPSSQSEPVRAPTFVPAYCDPNNERKGPKYERGLSTKEIAKRLRAEVKDALKSGLLPKGVKVSITYDSFAGGSAIRVRITACPFTIYNPEWLRYGREHPHDPYPPLSMLERYTPAAKVLRATLTDMAMAYNRNNSDSSTDYYDVNFYGGDAEFDYDLEQAEQKAFEQEIP